MKSLAFSLLIATTIWLSVQPSIAQSLTSRDIPGLVAKAGVLAKGYESCSAVIRGDRVHLTVPRNPNEDANDLKINALLLGKIVMEKDPRINIVRVYYYERVRGAANSVEDKYTFVDASKANVKGYLSGGVEKDELLASMVLHIPAMEQGVCPGPLREYRTTLQSEINVRRGLDATDLGPLLPTIDPFAERMKAINEMARTNKSPEKIEEELDKLHRELKAEMQRFMRLDKANRAEADRQRARYAATHGIVLPQKTQPKQINLPDNFKTAKAMSPDEYAALAKKYPDLVVNASYPLELDHRKGLSKFLISRFEDGKGKEADVDEFKRIEYFASQDDRPNLRSMFTATERRVGYKHVPGSGN